MPDGPQTPPEVISSMTPENIGELKGWDMSDPRKHDPENFRYIVHALSDDDFEESLAMDHYNAGLDSGNLIEPPVDPTVDAKKFLERKYISCSVIDPDHMVTTGQTGVILAVDKDNILQAYSTDAGITYNETVYDLNADPNLPDADTILQNTMPSDYNELLVTGKSETGSNIKYAGVFTFVYAPGKSTMPALDKKIREFAKKQKIPVIEFS